MRSKNLTMIRWGCFLACACLTLFNPPKSAAQSARELAAASRAALNDLYSHTPAARQVGSRSVAVLVFPHILKAGFVVGAQGGRGTLLSRGRALAYFQTISGSYGFQAGLQRFGYALFFIDRKSLGYLYRSHGWEIGVGPSVVIVDEGVAKSISTTTLQPGIYAFIFDQRGLMAGVGLQGTKIARFYP